MLPVIHLRCTCGQQTRSLRQGQGVTATDGPQSDEGRPYVSAFEYDCLCLRCNTMTAGRWDFAEPLSAAAAWARYHTAMEESGFRLSAPCGHCGSEEVYHALLIAKLADLNSEETDQSPQDTPCVWWETYHKLNEYYEELEFLYPRHGSPAENSLLGLWEGVSMLGEAALRSTLGLPGSRRTLDRWSAHNARKRRQLHRQFLHSLPREFRNDFRLKQQYLLTSENRERREDLLREVRRRIELSEAAGPRQAAPAMPQRIRCASCERGFLVQSRMRLSQMN